jgi:UDP-glucuronate decarboxylase
MNKADAVVQQDQAYIFSNLQEEFQKMAGKRLLITGGAGFLGYYLIHAVLYWNHHTSEEQNIHLTVYDNYIRGIPTWLAKLKGEKNLELIKQDIIQPLPADIGDIQYIIHAAGIASPIYYRLHPIETMDANIIGIRNLLEYCQQQKAAGKPVEGFLYYSSSEIYGDPDAAHIPTEETFRGFVSCTGPRACYDESKRYGETLCVNFAQVHDLPIKIARPFNNYGPGLKISDRRVIPDFARDIFAGRDIVMFSDGSPTRTFCYIADAVIGYYKVLVKGQKGEAYNIGVETPEISMAKLAEILVQTARDLFGYQGKVVRPADLPKDYLVDNPNRRCPVIEKARTQLGYNPSILVEEGVRRSLLWYSDNCEAEDA